MVIFQFRYSFLATCLLPRREMARFFLMIANPKPFLIVLNASKKRCSLRRCDGSVTLLSRGVPDLGLDHFAINLGEKYAHLANDTKVKSIGNKATRRVSSSKRQCDPLFCIDFQY